MLVNTWQPLVKFVRCISCVSYLSFFFYTGLLARASPKLHRLNLTYRSKSFPLLGFCLLFICMTDQPKYFPYHLTRTSRTISVVHM